jgi:hypothetical protein
LSNLRKMWVKRSFDIDLLATAGTTSDNPKVPNNGPPLLIVHVAYLLIADPCVNTSTTRVDPHDMFKAKVLAQCIINDLDGHGHELPALVANIGLVAAGTDVVVVCQIDIKAQFLGNGLQRTRITHRLTVARVCVVYGSDFETRGHEAEHVLAQPGGVVGVS